MVERHWRELAESAAPELRAHEGRLTLSNTTLNDVRDTHLAVLKKAVRLANEELERLRKEEHAARQEEVETEETLRRRRQSVIEEMDFSCA